LPASGNRPNRSEHRAHERSYGGAVAHLTTIADFELLLLEAYHHSAVNETDELQTTSPTAADGTTVTQHKRPWLHSRRFRRQIMPWLFIAPITLLHLVVVVGPSVAGMYYSLTEWSGIGQAEFVGLDNFRELFFEDRNFLLALRHNLMWLAFFLTVPFVMALAVAALLAQVRIGSMAIRTAFFIPYVLPSVVVASIWRMLLDPRLGFGVALENWGIKGLAYPYLGDKNTALAAIAFVDNWHWWGFLMILGIFHSSFSTWTEIFGGFLRFGTMPTGGTETTNILTSLAEGKGMPDIDLSTIALLAAFAAIAGSGGLSNAAGSNYTREQGWGMGRHVGAIPSVIGGRELKLSHSGTVFQVTSEALARWKRWYRHLVRDQVVVWMPACFLGVALPSMLSVQFLPRGTEASSWVAAGMTSDGVRTHVAAAWGADAGQLFWYLTMLCGFLVLGPTMSTHSDGFIRRWVDVFWTASPRLRKLDPSNIRWVYFAVVVGYGIFGVIMLSVAPPLELLKFAANLFNYALGFSCFHTLFVNLTLLPEALRPGWFMRIGLAAAGTFFTLLAVITTLQLLGVL